MWLKLSKPNRQADEEGSLYSLREDAWIEARPVRHDSMQTVLIRVEEPIEIGDLFVLPFDE